MRGRHASWVRAAGGLAVLGIVAGALITSPVGAVPGLTAAKVKKIAKQQATRALKRASHAHELRLLGPFDMNDTAGIDLDDPASLMASLPLDRGSYTISASLTLSHAGGINAGCELRAGLESDEAHAYASTGINTESSVMNLAHTFAEPAWWSFAVTTPRRRTMAAWARSRSSRREPFG